MNKKDLFALYLIGIIILIAGEIAVLFIFLSLFIGNTAYESGNISGTSMGLETFIGSSSL